MVKIRKEYFKKKARQRKKRTQKGTEAREKVKVKKKNPIREAKNTLGYFFCDFSSQLVISSSSVAMDLEGIFRISGLASDIDKLVKQFEAAGNGERKNTSKFFSLHLSVPSVTLLRFLISFSLFSFVMMMSDSDSLSFFQITPVPYVRLIRTRLQVF